MNYNDLFSQLDKIVLDAEDETVYFLCHSLDVVMLRTYFDICGPIHNSKLVTMGNLHKPSHAAKFVKQIGLSKMFGNSCRWTIRSCNH
jgi:hypothetical protein